MSRERARILSPVAEVLAPASTPRPRAAAGGAIGFIDNSKPNVAHVVQTLSAGVRAAGKTEIVTVTKPRSAGPLPDLGFLIEHCRFVVNAVAD
jgi:hypothetical protein